MTVVRRLLGPWWCLQSWRTIRRTSFQSYLSLKQVRDAGEGTFLQDLAVHPRIPALKEKEIVKLMMTAMGPLSVGTIIVNNSETSSMRRMTVALNQKSLQQNHSKDVKAEISYQDLAVHQRVPALKEKETAKLITTVKEISSVETIIANSLVQSSMKRMIAV